ncbi:transcription regulator [Carnobacterium sp. 17-4]|uniref:helix-turn-helix domain-containing protein n=1 Tax=Carnobacterium sp. (strain 17-4) TaxID=208596 RepID=UPI00020588D1|nr:Rgg/GadR/MutR family transcriptional regulator [Carnobacterium sp. 17-4]AEB28834.1 transcription regulator [Carnobacterium sp. 17-4]
MKIGKVIKTIRTSKKIKTSNTYSNILSRPAISKFEKGLSDTTSTKLFQILNNLNVSLDEFYLIYNNYNLDDEHTFLSKYSQYFYQNDIENLKKLKISLKEKYKVNNQIKLFHYSVLTDLTISYILNEKPNSKSLDILQSYLLNCEDWTYYEIVLFTNSLDLFSEEQILLLYKRTKSKLEHFKMLRKYNNEIFSLLSNILVIFIKKNNINKSCFFYEELKNNMSETINTMYEKTMMIFFKELVTIMSSKNYNNKNIEKIISLFVYLDMPLKEFQCTSLFEVVKSNNQIT